MIQTYVVTVDGQERLRFRADFTNSGFPLLIVDPQADTEKMTTISVRDATHRPHNAARMLNDWCEAQGGGCWGGDEDWDCAELEDDG